MSGRKGNKGNRGRGGGGSSGPAIMMMPPHIRATFMPNPPLRHIPPVPQKRKKKWTGVFNFMAEFENGKPPDPGPPKNPKLLKQERLKVNQANHSKKMEPKLIAYRNEQKECGGEYEGMNCYNTLFVGRLAYEVTERKLLREFEVFGPIKDLRIVKDESEGTSTAGKSKGYAFIEFEQEEDMKRAYRSTDGMKLEGKPIVVDVERGHTVPNWLPRRLGGGLGGTRLGAPSKNIVAPGRFDPNRPAAPSHFSNGGPPMSMGRGGGPPPPQHQMGPGYNGGGFGRGGGGGQQPFGGYGASRGRGGGGDRYGAPPPRGGGAPPPRDWDRGGRYDREYRKRGRSRSPDRWDSRSSRRRY